MNFKIKHLGKAWLKSPLANKEFDPKSFFVSEKKRLRYDALVYQDKKKVLEDSSFQESFELAGPREKVYFNPAKVRSAIITCGGLCPGVNDVIRSIVMESYYRYGNKNIFGIPFGYKGLNPKYGYSPMKLTPEKVENIHKEGGSILGSSRGGAEDKNLLVDTLVKLKINILYAIGGDGTLKGAHEIAKIALKRNLNLAVIGIPKTIDNDINFIERSFGFETAFSKAVDAISSAHLEAKGAPNGIGLVKVMGRSSGFIAAHAALAMNDTNFVLVPEVDFDLEGKNGLLSLLQKRLKKRNHAVICVAEGAGQKFFLDQQNSKFDESGNPVLHDIGLFLEERIKEYFSKKDIMINLKYINPSYIIRTAPANANDSLLCALLGQYAVHAAMTGKTDMIVGNWHQAYTHVPIELVVANKKRINPNSLIWYNVIEATGQPFKMLNKLT